MSAPTRSPQGARTVSAVNADLFALAEQYLGDATQWTRIADLNAVDGVPPDYLVTGPVTLTIPPKGSGTGDTSQDVSIERILFGVGA